MKTPSKTPHVTVDHPHTGNVEKPGTPPVEMPPLPKEIVDDPAAVSSPDVQVVEFPAQPHEHGMSDPNMSSSSEMG